MISYVKGSFGKHLKNRQIPYQSVRGPWLCSLGCRPNNGTHTLFIRSVNDDIELLISVSLCAVSSMLVSCCISVFDLFDESILVYFSVFFDPTCTPFQC